LLAYHAFMEAGTTTHGSQWIFYGCINRVGTVLWNGENFGSSYFVDPCGQIFAQARRQRCELLVADFDLDRS
jgi:N-carbamoylputrescine amidase